LTRQDIILGAGVSGLAAAQASGLRAYEAEAAPGGICRSYYVRPGAEESLPARPSDGDAYRFEAGGGHWIFGGDPAVATFLCACAPMKSYRRRSAVYFPESGRLVPYPLQYHLSHLEPALAARALAEIRHSRLLACDRLSEWLEQTFGPTLTELFFAPFHAAYTAGWWTRVAPQDAFKSPLDLAQVERGARGDAVPAGYNQTFLYPESGLDALVSGLARDCRLACGRRVAGIDLAQREVAFADGGGARFERLLSTLPLDRMMAITGLDVDTEAWPCTSVLTLNVGALRGPRCPDAHWIYLPRTQSGFFRAGFYNHVEPHFLPAGRPDRVSLYIERAFRSGERPGPAETAAYARAAVAELQSWGMIGEPDVVSPTWVETAYTWSLPGSPWRSRALARLREHGISMTGRYGLWRFQGIAESVRDGLCAGAAFRP